MFDDIALWVWIFVTAPLAIAVMILWIELTVIAGDRDAARETVESLMVELDYANAENSSLKVEFHRVRDNAKYIVDFIDANILGGAE
jgi:hypothetical protein